MISAFRSFLRGAESGNLSGWLPAPEKRPEKQREPGLFILALLIAKRISQRQAQAQLAELQLDL